MNRWAFMAAVGLYNQMNKLADAYQVEPDILPKRSYNWPDFQSGRTDWKSVLT